MNQKEKLFNYWINKEPLFRKAIRNNEIPLWQLSILIPNNEKKMCGIPLTRKGLKKKKNFNVKRFVAKVNVNAILIKEIRKEIKVWSPKCENTFMSLLLRR